MAIQATPAGLEQAKAEYKRKFTSQQTVADLAKVSRGTIDKFFKRTPIRPDNFRAICEVLGLSFETVAASDTLAAKPETLKPEQLANRDAVSAQSELLELEQPKQNTITTLVQVTRAKIRPLIYERYGKMRMLEVGWVPVDEIYVSLNVLEPVGHNCLFAEQRDQLQTNSSDSDHRSRVRQLHRIGLSQSSRQAEAALAVLKNYKKAILLGTPGAGKTTLLRALAVECIKRVFVNKYCEGIY